MASSFAFNSPRNLQWEKSEIPESCYVRYLTPALSDSRLRDSDGLPIEQDRESIKEAILCHRVVAVRSATGSGKTMKLPEYLFQVLNSQNKSWRDMRPVLVVQKAGKRISPRPQSSRGG